MPGQGQKYEKKKKDVMGRRNNKPWGENAKRIFCLFVSEISRLNK